MKPSEIKASLLAQLAAAPPTARHDFHRPVWVAPDPKERTPRAQVERLEEAHEERSRLLVLAVGHITLQAGPCMLTVLNTQIHRERARRAITGSSGFKDGGQKYHTPGRFTIPAQALTAEEIAQAHQDYLADIPVEDLC